MMQLYFLSVVTVTLSGLILSADMLAAKFDGFIPVRDALMKPSIRLTTAVLTGIVSLFTLLYMSPEQLPVVGDLLPSLLGLAMTFTLGYEHYLKNSTIEDSIDDPALHPLIRYKGLLGFAGILAGILHFILPQAIIL